MNPVALSIVRSRTTARVSEMVWNSDAHHALSFLKILKLCTLEEVSSKKVEQG